MGQVLEQQFLKPGRYRIGGHMRDISRSDLKQYKDGTVKALKNGLHIPLLSVHAELGAEEGGPKLERDEEDARNNVGWIIDMKQRSDGSLVQVMDVTSKTAADGINDGSIKFTSPELCEDYTDGLGRNYGRIVRHSALTSTPRNPDQGDFSNVSDSNNNLAFSQFSLDDFITQGTKMAKSTQFADAEVVEDVKETPEDAGDGTKSNETIVRALLDSIGVFFPMEADLGLDETQMEKLVEMAELLGRLQKQAEEAHREAEKNSDQEAVAFAEHDDDSSDDSSDDSDSDDDSDEKATKAAKEAEITSLLKDMGVELPDDFDFQQDDYRDVLISALKLASSGEEEDLTVREEPNVLSQFSEKELNALSPIEKALLEENQKTQATLTQFTEDRNKERTILSRARISAEIKASAIPPGLKKVLLAKADSVQFSEKGVASPHYTSSEVIKLVQKFTPKHLQFAESDTAVIEAPEDLVAEEDKQSGMHVTQARAKEIAADNNGGWRHSGYSHTSPDGPGVGIGRSVAESTTSAKTNSKAGK